MKLQGKPRRPHRSVHHPLSDIGSINISRYNEYAGADKVIIVQPDIVKATAANEQVGAGKYIKVNATAYDLKCVGRDYDANHTYNIGDICVNGGFVYQANHDRVTGAFDATKWVKKADATIAGIPCVAGDVVSTGMWHNAISIAGFLVADDSEIAWIAQRR